MVGADEGQPEGGPVSREGAEPRVEDDEGDLAAEETEIKMDSGERCRGQLDFSTEEIWKTLEGPRLELPVRILVEEPRLPGVDEVGMAVRRSEEIVAAVAAVAVAAVFEAEVEAEVQHYETRF